MNVNLAQFERRGNSLLIHVEDYLLSIVIIPTLIPIGKKCSTYSFGADVDLHKS